jgi:radical SAM protein with 4Fe4S-binding SPASM domain
MANLSITADCPGTCSFCFAGDVLHRADMPRRMSRRVFLDALDLVRRSGMNSLRLLGGEPTQHPDFAWMLERAFAAELGVTVFTGGWIPAETRNLLADIEPTRLSIVVNLSRWSGRKTELMQAFGRKMIPGFTITNAHDLPDATEVIDAVDRYKLARTVRIGLAHPNTSHTNRYVRPRRYAALGARLATWLGQLRAADVEPGFDCGFVPCMFPSELAERMQDEEGPVGCRCNPVLDILPDGSVIHCYPLAAAGRAKPDKSADADSLRRQFAAKTAVLHEAGVFRECSGCRWRARGLCNGGCAAVAAGRLHRQPFEVSLPAQSPGDQ